MTPQTSNNLAKQLLLACDQSYFDGSHAPATVLGPLPDMTSTDPDYINLNIYTDIPQFSWQGDYVLAGKIEDVGTGAKLVIYQKAGSGEVIVAFGGTDGTDLKDWVANTQNVGWSQWGQLKISLFNTLATLNPTQVHFTGQSLGGALAQYAAYDYVLQKKIDANNAGTTYVPSKVDLTTFNGLGAVWGLSSNGKKLDGNGGYDPSVLTGLGAATHYVVANDLVSRLGGGHIGTDGNVVYLDWKYLDGKSVGKPMDIADAHRIETAFYTHLDASASALGLPGTSESLLLGGKFLLNGKGAVKWAGAFGSFLNDEKLSAPEALFRLIGGLSGVALTASPQEIDDVCQAAFKAQHDAGKMSDFTYGSLDKLNMGIVSKLAFFNKPGIAIALASLVGAVLVQTLSQVGKLLGSAFTALGFGSPLEPVGAADIDEVAVRLNAALADHPEAFKKTGDQQCATTIDTCLGSLDLGDTLANAVSQGGAHWFLASLSALEKALLGNPAYTALSPAEKARALTDTARAYQQLALSSAREHAGLTAGIIADSQAFARSELGTALAKINPDFLKPGSSSLVLSGLNDFNDKKIFTDTLLAGLQKIADDALSFIVSPASAAQIEADFNKIEDDIARAGEVIILTPGTGDPFAAGGILDPNGTESSSVSEGAIRGFTLSLPYAAGSGGQHIKLTLQGVSAGSFSVLVGGRRIKPGASGSFELVVEDAATVDLNKFLWKEAA